MKFPKWNKSIIAFMVISFLSVSFGGALLNSAYAADVKSIFKASSCQSGNAKSTDKAFSAIGSILDKIMGGKISNNQKLPYNPGQAEGQNKPGQNNAVPNNNNNNSNNNSSALSSYEAEAVRLLNADRAAQGLPALKVNMDLVRLAEDYAQDMINRGFFAHENPEGLSPFDRMKNAGINYRWAGENLAINSNVSAAQKAFMSSDGHRANILNPNYTHVGIGVKIDRKGSFYVVQEFIGI